MNQPVHRHPASQIAEIYSPRSISSSVQEVYLHRQEAFASHLEREKSVLIDDGDDEIKRVGAKYRVEAVEREWRDGNDRYQTLFPLFFNAATLFLFSPPPPLLLPLLSLSLSLCLFLPFNKIPRYPIDSWNVSERNVEVDSILNSIKPRAKPLCQLFTN